MYIGVHQRLWPYKIDIIDRSYLLMSPLSLDEFCNWIYNERSIWNNDLLQINSGIEIKDTSTSLNKGRLH